MKSSLQLTLKKWVEDEGGKLLVIGVGGTQDNGRWAELTNILPVSCGIDNDCSTVLKTIYAPKLMIKDYDKNSNKLMEYIDVNTPMTEANGSITIADVSTVAEGKELFQLAGFDSADKVKAGVNGNIHPGILERTAGMKGGKVVYISFNPTKENITPGVEENLVINLVAYAIGVDGYKSA